MLLKKLLLFCTAFTLSIAAFSTHIKSMEINAKHISGSQYKVSLKMWSDCAGIAPPSVVTISSGCGSTSTTFTLTQEYSIDTIGVNSGCSNYFSNTTCSGGSLPNAKYNVYSALVTLPSCTNLVLSYNTCCRTTSITNLSNSASSSIHIESAINTSQFPSNSTSQFPITNQVLANNSSSLNLDFSAFDMENDSLVYSLVSAQTAYNTNAVYQTSYSAASPLPGLTINSQTGEISKSTSSTVGEYVLVVQVDEYDRLTGTHKGFTKRETVISMVPSAQFSNTPCTYTGLSNVTGGTNVANNLITACQGSALSFDITYSHPTNQPSLWSPLNHEITGATYSVSQNSSSTMSVNLPATTTPGTYKFYVQAISDTCYFAVPTYDTFSVIIEGGLYTSGDTSICLGDSISLMASGSNNYVWTPSASLSCTSCPNPVATPTSTTTFYVSGSGTSSCASNDSVTITVDTPITYNGNDTTICIGNSVSLSASGSGNYMWSPGNELSCTTCPNPIATPTSNTTYYVSSAGNSSCTSTDSVTITVDTLVSYNGNDTTICLGNSVTLSASGSGNLVWSPSASLSCTTCANPTATPNVTTTYSVSAGASSTCQSSDSVTITVDSLSTYNGVISESNGTAYSNTLVYLIVYNAVDSTVTAVDSMMTNTTGNYSFTTSEGTVWIKVAPDSSNYPNQIPTYNSGSALFLSSSSISAVPCGVTTTNFSSLSGVNQGGAGFISGNVYQGAGKTDGAGDPVANVNLVLMNSQDQPVKYWKTDAQGALQFSDLSYGTYRVFVDNPKIDNSIAPVILVDENSKNITYNFNLNSNSLVRTSPNSIKSTGASTNVLIYPNPFENQFTIQATEKVNYTITNLNGSIVQQGVSNNETIQVTLADYAKGIYFVTVTSSNETNIFKVVKK